MNQPIKIDRLPPHDLSAEKAVLGASMSDACSLAEAVSAGAGEMMYDPKHRVLFSAMTELQDAGDPVTTIALIDHLKCRNVLEKAGGTAFISNLPDEWAGTGPVAYYIKILHKHFYARTVIARATDLVTMAYDAPDDLTDLADQVESEIFALRSKTVRSVSSRKESFRRVAERIEEATYRDGKLPGLPTGYPDLDRALGGLRKGALVTLAARPGMGKSSLAMNIAEKNALSDACTPVGVFSLEMSEDEINFRSLGSVAGVDMADIYNRGSAENGEISKLITYIGKLQAAPIEILDRCDANISQIRAEARRLVAQKNVQLIVVDYMQLVSGTRRYENRTQEVSEVSRGLKKMARELNIPVLALAQLNREIDKDTGRRPRLSDLRESGSIEADSDVVIFLYAGEQPEGGIKDHVVTKVSIAKNRGGSTEEVTLLFRKPILRFENVESFAKIDQQDLPTR